MTEAQRIAARVKSAVIRRRRFAVQVVKDIAGGWGACDAPNVPGKAIKVRRALHGPALLDTLIHEALHAGCWDLGEEAVEEIATDIARLLWRAGYRLE